MPRVHTQKAGKDYPHIGVKKGETYYWWKFRYGGKRMSKTYPKQSQLTQSEFLSTVYSITEEWEALTPTDFEAGEGIADKIEEWKGQLEEQRDQCESSRDAMPEHLQDVGTGEMLQNRYEAADEMINELDNIDTDFDFDEDGARQELEDELEEEKDGGEEIDDEDAWMNERLEAKKKEQWELWIAERIEEIQNITYNGE